MTHDARPPDEELIDLQDLGLLIDDRDTAERLIRVVGSLAELYEVHAFDGRGRCSLCRPSGRRVLWRRRQPCSVRQALASYRVSMASLRV